MVLPPGHHLEITSGRRFSRRERWIVGTVAAGLAVFVVVLIVALSGPTQSSAPGCVDVSILGATGAALLHQCGADARALCLSAGKPGGYTGDTAREIQAVCRQHGLPVG
jgi:hypothetical protein